MAKMETAVVDLKHTESEREREGKGGRERYIFAQWLGQ
jgi:hypothetical protein